MAKNSKDFSPQDVMKMAKSPAGQQLIAMLQNADPSALQKAMAQAAAGNYEEAKTSLTPLMESEKIKSLLQQMGGNPNG